MTSSTWYGVFIGLRVGRRNCTGAFCMESLGVLPAQSPTLQGQLTQAGGVNLPLSTTCSHLNGLGTPRAQLWDEKK